MKEEALKLADELEKYLDIDYDPDSFDKAIKMIRRLVEELDKQKYQNELLENSIKFAMLANNLQDKQGEPVVYWDGKHFASKEKSSLADIPLYTTSQTKPLNQQTLECPSYLHNFAPQTKPLSDEEITFLWHKSMGLAISDDNLKNNISHASIFARAIEERMRLNNG